jgi:serine phosphatase RsbU (regulator of sigma subunit)
VTSQDAQRRASDRAELVAAAREHSAAVGRHLERIAVRLRDRVSSTTSGTAAAETGAGAGAASPARPAVGDLSRLLLAEADLQSLLRTVLSLARNAVQGCDGASISLVRDGHVETAAATDDDVAAADRAQYPRREGPCYDAATQGETRLAAVLPDPRWPAFGQRAARLGWAGVLSVPLQTRAGRLGGLNLYSRSAGAFGAAEAAVSEALAEQVAVALTNARDFRQQQGAATSLQRSLLPPQLPELPGLDFAARYHPASTGINVGGDWYDVLRLPSGHVALVIGDVAGHGLAAATTMAQLRTAVRAYALEGHEAVEVINLVDSFLQAVDAEAYATCCYVVLDPALGDVRWCNAGHPDPLVLTRDGCVRPLAGAGHRPALGVPHVPRTAGAGATVLPRGARLLLFTDGLIERRRESLDVGIDRLARSAAVLGSEGADLEAWCGDVVAAQVGDREVGDDVAVLAVELTGGALEATPSQLAHDHQAPRVAG